MCVPLRCFLAALALLNFSSALLVKASAQDRPKIEIVPNIAHSDKVLSRRVASGKVLHIFDEHTFSSAAFSPDGTRAVSRRDEHPSSCETS
jgi:hypothetical protein